MSGLFSREDKQTKGFQGKHAGTFYSRTELQSSDSSEETETIMFVSPIVPNHPFRNLAGAECSAA